MAYHLVQKVNDSIMQSLAISHGFGEWTKASARLQRNLARRLSRNMARLQRNPLLVKALPTAWGFAFGDCLTQVSAISTVHCRNHSAERQTGGQAGAERLIRLHSKSTGDDAAELWQCSAGLEAGSTALCIVGVCTSAQAK